MRNRVTVFYHFKIGTEFRERKMGKGKKRLRGKSVNDSVDEEALHSSAIKSTKSTDAYNYQIPQFSLKYNNHLSREDPLRSDLCTNPHRSKMSSTFSGDETAPFFGFLGAAAALVFSCKPLYIHGSAPSFPDLNLWLCFSSLFVAV